MFDTIFMKIIIIIFLSSIKIFLKYFLSQYFYFWEEINIFKALLFFFNFSQKKKLWNYSDFFFFFLDDITKTSCTSKSWKRNMLTNQWERWGLSKKKRALGVWCGSRIVTNIICHTDSHRVRQSGRHTHHSA